MANPQRNTSVITEVVGDGLGVFDPNSQQSYVLNATSALVFQHADGQTTPLQLTNLLRQKFNVPHSQADKLLWVTLDELQQADLVQGATTTEAPRPVLSRRQMLSSMAVVGLSLALAPMVAPITVQAAGDDTLIPLLDCVVDNGDGTYTAYFGYLNLSGTTITLPVGSKNKFEPSPQDRGQPTVFQPGEYHHVFTVTFDGSKIKWMLKADGDRRQQVDADANSGCAVPPTTTPPPTTTQAPPTTTQAPPTTTQAPPTTTQAPPTTTQAPPTTTQAPPTTTPRPPTPMPE